MSNWETRYNTATVFGRSGPRTIGIEYQYLYADGKIRARWVMRAFRKKVFLGYGTRDGRHFDDGKNGHFDPVAGHMVCPAQIDCGSVCITAVLDMGYYYWRVASGPPTECERDWSPCATPFTDPCISFPPEDWIWEDDLVVQGADPVYFVDDEEASSDIAKAALELAVSQIGSARARITKHGRDLMGIPHGSPYYQLIPSPPL